MSRQHIISRTENSVTVCAPEVDATKCEHPNSWTLLVIACWYAARHSARPRLVALADIAFHAPEIVLNRALEEGTNARFAADCLGRPIKNLGELLAALGIDLTTAQALFCDGGPTMQGWQMARRFRLLAQKGTLVRTSRRR